LRKGSVDRAYIESRPEPSQTELKLVVETKNAKLAATMRYPPFE